jgi:hypothetical protein
MQLYRRQGLGSIKSSLYNWLANQGQSSPIDPKGFGSKPEQIGIEMKLKAGVKKLSFLQLAQTGGVPL